jgi:hypothetical protein
LIQHYCRRQSDIHTTNTMSSSGSTPAESRSKVLSKSKNPYDSDSPVEWGVRWHKEPTSMVLLLAGGLALAISHHFYYFFLNNTQAGSTLHQQWASALGNVFAFSVSRLLAAASIMAYNQYLWKTVRGNLLQVCTLGELFALTSDP